MRFSWKSFLLSFGVAFVIFSVVMACICADIFRGRVRTPDFAAETVNGATLAEPSSRNYESYLFICDSKDGITLDFAVLVRIDTAGRRMLITPAYGDYLVECGGSLYFLRSLTASFGEDELAAMFASATGCEVPKEHILNLRAYLPDSVKNSTVRYLDFAEILPTVWPGVTDDYTVIECPLVTEENNDLKIVSVKKTLETFREFEKQ